jgi:hypothetical protein
MPTPSRRTPSTQQSEVPEPVASDARPDATAELGSEGGSYGDQTQHTRSRREWGGTADSPSTGWLARAAVAALFIVIAAGLAAAVLAVMFWGVGS